MTGLVTPQQWEPKDVSALLAENARLRADLVWAQDCINAAGAKALRIAAIDLRRINDRDPVDGGTIPTWLDNRADALEGGNS